MKPFIPFALMLALAACQPSTENDAVAPAPAKQEAAQVQNEEQDEEQDTSSVTPTTSSEDTAQDTAQAPDEPVTVVEAAPNAEIGMAVASSQVLGSSCGYTTQEQGVMKDNIMKQYSLTAAQHKTHLEQHGPDAQQAIQSYRDELAEGEWETRCENLKSFLVTKQ